MLMYGTTVCISGVLNESVPSRELFSTPGVFEGTHILIGAAATSGALTKWIRDNFSEGMSFGELTEEAAKTPPGSAGLVVLPYFAGERTPLYDAGARGVIAGLTLSHTRGHLYRAMLEATAYSARSMLDALHKAGVESNRLVAIGGGTKGGLWTQIVSDVTGITQELSTERIGPATATRCSRPGRPGWSARRTTGTPSATRSSRTKPTGRSMTASTRCTSSSTRQRKSRSTRWPPSSSRRASLPRAEQPIKAPWRACGWICDRAGSGRR